MKQPTRMQLFFAQDWPLKIWFTTAILLCWFFSIRFCEPTIASLTDWRYILLLTAVTALSIPIGFLGGLIAALYIIYPLYYLRGIMNGGPFKVGDLVQILKGPHQGQITNVYSEGQGNSVCVRLGKDDAKKCENYFSPTDLLREDDATPEH